MLKSPKLIAYIIILLFFLSYLVLATNIVSIIMPNSVKKVNINIDALKKDPVLYTLDRIEYLDDFYGNIQLSGWAFCETLEDNSEKEIWFIFKSEKSTYMFENELQSSEITSVFNSIYDIRGKNHRFGNTLSTAVMKNGLYKIYIYCKENNENYGLVDTNIMIKKDSSGICEYVWHSSPQNITETEIGANTICTIDSVTTTDDGYTQIVGWAFTEGLDTNNQSVYVRLTYEDGNSVTYDTQSISRPDVVTAYKSQLYNNSGFTAIIPKDELQDGNIQIDVLVKNGDSIYLAEKKYVYVYNDFEESFILREAKERETVNKEINIDLNNIKEDSNIKYYVDSCTLGEFLSIKGWAYISDKNASNTSVYLAITKPDGSTRVFSTAKVSRSDVAKHFNNELYYESGFKSVIPQDAIVEGDNIITIITEDGEMVKASKTYTFSYTNEK